MKTEELYYDKHGKPIHEFALLKFFHFIGARRKKHYMYKWVRIKDGHYCGVHLNDDEGSSFWLKAGADASRVIDAEIVQCHHEYRMSGIENRLPAEPEPPQRSKGEGE